MSKAQVKLLQVLGGDLTVVNAARVSFMKAVHTLSDKDKGLIRFLAREGHTSPFRHVVLKLAMVTSSLQKETIVDTMENVGSVIRPKLSEQVPGEIQEWTWTASLQALVEFCEEYWESSMMYDVVEGVLDALKKVAPYSTQALLGLEYEVSTAPEKPQLNLRSDVLDKGYVRLVDWIGDTKEDSDEEIVVQFEVYAPLMVRSQWFKYVRQSEHTPPMFVEHPTELAESGNGDDGNFDDPLYARNEASRRYVTLNIEHYVPAPDQWRSAPENKKQGSGEPLSPITGSILTDWLMQAIDDGMERYRNATDKGVATEQARLFLPAAYGLYACWYWTASLKAVKHFLAQRLEHDAQWEINQYAKAVNKLLKDANII